MWCWCCVVLCDVGVMFVVCIIVCVVAHVVVCISCIVVCVDNVVGW